MIGPFAINVLPLKAQVKHRVTGSPTPHYPLEFEITFCVRGVISPLLSNLVLDELDREPEQRRHCIVRYADDCNIYVRSRRAGERVKLSITGFIMRRLTLKVNKAKSAVARPVERKFLGFSFTGARELKRRILPRLWCASSRRDGHLRDGRGVSVSSGGRRNLPAICVAGRATSASARRPRCGSGWINGYGTDCDPSSGSNGNAAGCGSEGYAHGE